MDRTFHRDPSDVSMVFAEVSASVEVICIRHFDKLFALAPVWASTSLQCLLNINKYEICVCIFKHKQIHFFLGGKIKQTAPTPIMYVDSQRGRGDEVRSDVSSPDHRPITRKRHFFLQQKTDTEKN